MVGLEQALSIAILTRSDGNGAVDWEAIARVTSATPAKIGQLSEHGQGIVVGAPASFVLVDPARSQTVDPRRLSRKGRNTPYAGLELPGKVVATFLNGTPTVLDGKATK